MYKKTNVCIESYEGLVIVDGWILDDQRWNGWAIPVFGFAAAQAIAEEIGLDYDAETKTYKETPKSAGDTDWFEDWTSGFNEELGEETVAIGACYWCWDDIEDDEIKNLDMKVIDRRVK